MRYHDQETAFGAMLETATQEFEGNLRLPHLTLCVNEATGEYQFLRGDVPVENGLLQKLTEIGKPELRAT